MNEELFTPKQLAKLFGVTQQTLSQWEREGKIKAIKTEGGHRRYIHQVPRQPKGDGAKRNFVYARVSSAKQTSDLQRQLAALQEAHPDYEVIQDVGSGINFKRRGLITLLDLVLGGNVSKVVVAHRDRLTRFGFELFELIFSRFGVSLEVMSDNDVKEPITELAKDIVSIITVFTARYHGSRSYQVRKENQVLSQSRANNTSKPVRRGIKVLLQQSRGVPQRKRIGGIAVEGQAASPSHEKRRRHPSGGPHGMAKVNPL